MHSRPGGFCIFCAAPARVYECSLDRSMNVAFCKACGEALRVSLYITKVSA